MLQIKAKDINELYTSYQKMVSEKLEGIWFDRTQWRIKFKIRSRIWNQSFYKMNSIILEMNYVKEPQKYFLIPKLKNNNVLKLTKKNILETTLEQNCSQLTVQNLYMKQLT